VEFLKSIDAVTWGVVAGGIAAIALVLFLNVIKGSCPEGGTMKTIALLAVLSTLVATGRADDGVLLQRIVALEQRVAELEAKLAPVLEQERVKEVVKQQQARARERMMMDGDIYQRVDLQTIEKLYQIANKDWKSEEAQKSLKLLIERYPRANRTGCAELYLGQMTTGDEQLDYLKRAIEHGDCYYGDGVNVGAYARLYLAMRYKKEGKDKEAAELFNDLRTNFPDAIDHKGKLLSTYAEGMD
jgi:hypothetical protein